MAEVIRARGVSLAAGLHLDKIPMNVRAATDASSTSGVRSSGEEEHPFHRAHQAKYKPRSCAVPWDA